MSSHGTDEPSGRRAGGSGPQLPRQIEELLRRNPRAVGMDLLILIATAFFTVLATKAWGTDVLPVAVPFSWPLLIAAIPIGGLLYFGWRSSREFLLAQLITIGLALLAVWADLMPI